MSAQSLWATLHTSNTLQLTRRWGLELTLWFVRVTKFRVYYLSECIIQVVLFESQMKNRTSVFKMTSSCSSTLFSGEKMKMPQKELVTLGRTSYYNSRCVQSWLISTCKMNSLRTNCTLCRNNVCFVNWATKAHYLPGRFYNIFMILVISALCRHFKMCFSMVYTILYNIYFSWEDSLFLYQLTHLI